MCGMNLAEATGEPIRWGNEEVLKSVCVVPIFEGLELRNCGAHEYCNERIPHFPGLALCYDGNCVGSADYLRWSSVG